MLELTMTQAAIFYGSLAGIGLVVVIALLRSAEPEARKAAGITVVGGSIVNFAFGLMPFSVAAYAFTADLLDLSEWQNIVLWMFLSAALVVAGLVLPKIWKR